MAAEFGRWLRRARTECGFSLMDLQSRAGINYTHISRMEGGHSRPSRETVVRLAEALNARADEALLAAFFLPFDATHLTDPVSSRLARRYHRLPPHLREIVEQALAIAEKLESAQTDGTPLDRPVLHEPTRSERPERLRRRQRQVAMAGG